MVSGKVVCFLRLLSQWSADFKTLCTDKSKSANKNIVWQPSLLRTVKRGFHRTKGSENLPTDCRKDKRGKMLNKLVLEI